MTPIVPLARVYDELSRILGVRPASLSPDAIASTRENVAWKAIVDWESKSDVELAVQAGLYAVEPSGSLLVATEASIAQRHGAFLVNGPALGALVAQHREKQGECFFNGDVVVVQCGTNHIWLFHHEGRYTTIGAD